jgi:hypothetical protein
MAEGIQVVAALSKVGVLTKPSGNNHALPNLFTFRDALTVIDQKLFLTYVEHVSSQGTLHAHPHYASWYGW